MKFLVGTLSCFGVLSIEMFASRSAPSGGLALLSMKKRHYTFSIHCRILDTLHTIFVTHAVYYYAVTNFFNFFALLKITWCVY